MPYLGNEERYRKKFQRLYTLGAKSYDLFNFHENLSTFFSWALVGYYCTVIQYAYYCGRIYYVDLFHLRFLSTKPTWAPEQRIIYCLILF